MTWPTTMLERARRLLPARAAARPRLRTLEKRIERLESTLEGLQDALYRQAVLEETHIQDLRRRTEPAQIARDLSRDARVRGL